MLTFKKGTYSEHELRVLYDVLSDAELSILEKAGCGDCHACKFYRPCHDLSNLLVYISALISERRAFKR